MSQPIEITDCGGYVIPTLEELSAADVYDAVVEEYKKDIDRTLIRQNLSLTIEQRLAKLQDFVQFLVAMRRSTNFSSTAANPRQEESVTGFLDLLALLARNHVEFFLIGGVAAAVHGAARATYVVDIVYARDPQNIDRLIGSLKGLDPYLRGAPRGLPFRWEAETLRQGLNFTLTTTLGDMDLFGEVAGGGTYAQLLPHTLDAELQEIKLKVVTLEKLIQLKRAAGRPRDLDAIAQLQAILEERRSRP